MSARIKQLIVCLVVLASVGLVLYFAGSTSPVKEGSSAAFWMRACGVDLGGQSDGPLGGFYQPREAWYIYYIQGYHTQFLFRVPRRQAVADFPEVLRRIKLAARDNPDPPNKVKWAAAVFEQNQAPSKLSPEEFLVLLHGERLKANRTKSEAAYRYTLSEDQAFDERWVRARRFWLNIVCESTTSLG